MSGILTNPSLDICRSERERERESFGCSSREASADSQSRTPDSDCSNRGLHGAPNQRTHFDLAEAGLTNLRTRGTYGCVESMSLRWTELTLGFFSTMFIREVLATIEENSKALFFFCVAHLYVCVCLCVFVCCCLWFYCLSFIYLFICVLSCMLVVLLLVVLLLFLLVCGCCFCVCFLCLVCFLLFLCFFL